MRDDSHPPSVDWLAFEDQVDAVAGHAAVLDMIAGHEDLDDYQRLAFRRVAEDLAETNKALQATFDAPRRESGSRNVVGADRRPGPAEA